MRGAMAHRPKAPFAEVAHETLAALRQPLDLAVDRATGLNERAMPTLHAFWRELKGTQAN